jgi:hypothetical protein
MDVGDVPHIITAADDNHTRALAIDSDGSYFTPIHGNLWGMFIRVAS